MTGEPMNHPSIPITELSSGPVKHLLDCIRAVQAEVGEGLNDDELTRLLRVKALPNEAGFAFLSYSNSFATLTVPPQELRDWHPEKGWIVPEKERIAKAIAGKYELSLSEPPDQVTNCWFTSSETPPAHHHIELTNGVETVVVAHPHYVKIRLFGAPPGVRYLKNNPTPLFLGPDLLQDLSALYQTNCSSSKSIVSLQIDQRSH